jgi:hypothetical protein
MRLPEWWIRFQMGWNHGQWQMAVDRAEHHHQ